MGGRRNLRGQKPEGAREDEANRDQGDECGIVRHRFGVFLDCDGVQRSPLPDRRYSGPIWRH